MESELANKKLDVQRTQEQVKSIKMQQAELKQIAADAIQKVETDEQDALATEVKPSVEMSEEKTNLDPTIASKKEAQAAVEEQKELGKLKEKADNMAKETAADGK